jgi:hypothetical protein
MKEKEREGGRDHNRHLEQWKPAAEYIDQED